MADRIRLWFPAKFADNLRKSKEMKKITSQEQRLPVYFILFSENPIFAKQLPMKQLFALFAVLFLLGCEDHYEDTYSYSKLTTQSKQYPVFLDMSEVGNIQVKELSPFADPFKILSNDKYYFVGDRLNGVHVFEKKQAGTSYQCFIACRYLKDFELADNRLFCNNLVDLVILDVSNPLKINVLNRQTNFFNRYTSYKKEWNIPYVEGKGLIAGTETHSIQGMITGTQPDLDFSAYDLLYGNLTTKVIPESWFSNYPENDKPYVGMVKMGADEIYTYGPYNSWAICTYRSGTFSAREEDLWTNPRGKYAPPYYYSDAWPVKTYFEDSMIYILGTGYNLQNGYCDCILYHESYPVSYHLYFKTFKPLDVTYLPDMNAYIALSGTSVWAAFKSKDPTSGYMERYKDYGINTDATEIIRAGDKVITLGKELRVYSPSEDELRLVREYPGISGICCKKEGNTLAVVNQSGLSFYDISDPENIHLIP